MGSASFVDDVSDQQGEVADSLLREARGIEAAKAFFRKAVATQGSTWPRKITLDGHAASHRAVRLLHDEDQRLKPVLVQSCRYLNNIVEQDHRAVKRRCASMLGFKSFNTATTTLADIELAHRIHEGQFSFGEGLPDRRSSLKSLWDLALLKSQPCEPRRNGFPFVRPPMHQNSKIPGAQLRGRR